MRDTKENIVTDYPVAIIIPVYNAEKYLSECLDSILAQTYTLWKCYLVNDGSTDRSQEVIDVYCKRDNRFISLVKENERSASRARYYGLQRVQEDWVMYVDSDDSIEENFIEAIVRRQQETNADCVTGRKIFCEHDLEGECWRIPYHDFDMSQILTGRECCLQTIGGWVVGGFGITRKNILLQVPPGSYMNSDELQVRQTHLLTPIHAFVDVAYYIRANEGTSDSVSVRMFDRTLVDMQLEELVQDNFPERKDKIKAIIWQRLFNLIYLVADYQIHIDEFTLEEKKHIQEILTKSYKALNRRNIIKYLPTHAWLTLLPYSLFKRLAYRYVTYKRSHGGKYFYR